jgi:hypothetical protein
MRTTDGRTSEEGLVGARGFNIPGPPECERYNPNTFTLIALSDTISVVGNSPLQEVGQQ